MVNPNKKIGILVRDEHSKIHLFQMEGGERFTIIYTSPNYTNLKLKTFEVWGIWAFIVIIIKTTAPLHICMHCVYYLFTISIN